MFGEIPIMNVTIHPLSNLSAKPIGIPPDERLIRRLERSFRNWQQQDRELAERFYARLFAQHPQIRPMFPAEMTAQKRKLMDTLTLVFENLRSPQTVRDRLRTLGMAHVAYGTRSEHYPLVCESLVAAMAELSGSEWTLELHADWTCAMRLISDVMMEAATEKR
jgi:hemoglobin-like flavoprotein